MDKTEKSFKWIINIFAKNDISFILSGGLAAKLYGSPRELRDIDFDIPDEEMKKIIPDVSKYVVYGPKEYKDDVFDLQLLRLNYEGQQIDISGGTNAKIYDKEDKIWINDSTNFSRHERLRVFNKNIPVIKPEELIEYKSKSPREEDLIDIRAIKQCLSNKF